jgi:hypothetical protein
VSIVRAFPQRPVWADLIRPNGHGPII